MVFNIHAKRNTDALLRGVASTPGLSKFCMIAKLTFLLIILCGIRVSAATDAITQDTLRISGTVTDSTGTPIRAYW